MPFFVRYITEFVRANGRFRLEPVLVSNRAVPSLSTCKRALREDLKHIFVGKFYLILISVYIITFKFKFSVRIVQVLFLLFIYAKALFSRINLIKRSRFNM